MDALAPEQLAAQAAHSLSPLYVIHGEEDLLRIEALDTLRRAAKEQGYLNRSVCSPETTDDWQALAAEAGSSGLFAERKLLEIHLPGGKPGKAGGEALQQLAEALPPDICTVVLLPKLDAAQLKSKWFAALAQHGSVMEAKAVSGQALPQWISGRLKAAGLSIEAEALSLFAERVEGNLLAAKQEVDKLALLYPAGHLISSEDAKQAVAQVARFDIFQLAAAWMGGDAARTLHLLEGLEAEGEEPVLLLWALAEDIRILIRLAAALKQGQSVQSVRNSLRLWGNKQTLAPQALKRLPPARLIEALQECARIDRIIKGAEEGEAWPAFKHLAARLAAARHGNIGMP